MLTKIFCQIKPNYTLYLTVNCIGFVFEELLFLNFIVITSLWHSPVFNSPVSDNLCFFPSMLKLALNNFNNLVLYII